MLLFSCSISGISLVLSSLFSINKAGSSTEISMNLCHGTLGLIQVIQGFPTALREWRIRIWLLQRIYLGWISNDRLRMKWFWWNTERSVCHAWFIQRPSESWKVTGAIFGGVFKEILFLKKQSKNIMVTKKFLNIRLETALTLINKWAVSVDTLKDSR